MKKLLVLSVSLGLAGSAAAQLFSPESFSGAAFGAVTGAIIGGRHAGAGAAIGAGAGWLLGTAIHESRVESGYYGPHYYSYYPYYPGYGYAPSYYYPPAYSASAPAVSVAAPANAGAAEASQYPQQNDFTTGPNAALGSPGAMNSANALFGR